MAISAEFTADFTQFTAAAGSAQDALAGVTQAAESIAIDRQAERAGKAIGALANSVAGFAADYLKSFEESENATARLSTALQNAGQESAATLDSYARMADQFQATTRYANNAVTAAQTALTEIGHIGPDQMEPAITAAANLASALGIGIEEAAQKLGVVIGSDGAKLGSLKKYLTDVEVKGKDAAGIIEVFNKKFGGAAAADMDTTAGKIANLNNKFDDMKSRVGELVARAITPLLDAFGSLPEPLQNVIAVVGGLALALSPVAIAIGSVVSAVTPLIALLGGAGGLSAGLAAVGAAAATLAAPLAIAVGAIAGVYLAFKNWDTIKAIAQSVYEAVKYWLVDQFKILVNQIVGPIETIVGGFKYLYDKVVGHSYVPDLIEGIEEQFGRLDAVMVAPSIEAAQQTEQALAGAMESIGELAGGALAGPGRAATGAFGKAMEGLPGMQLPGSRVETSAGVQYLVSPEGYRVPMERSATGGSSLPANWFEMYTGRSTVPLAGAFTGSGIARALSSAAPPAPVSITVQGNVLSTKDELARLVQDALMTAYRNGGNMLPV